MNILVVGGGSIGRRHIKNLQELGHKTIYCLKRAKDAQFASENCVEVVCSFEEISAKTISAVIVCTPTSLHNEALEFAAKNNLAIFMEKPLIHNSEGLTEAKQILIDYKNVFFIGFMLRYHPLVKKIKEIIDSNELGKVYSARFEFGSYLPYWHPWEDYQISYASRKELGGGVINTITHELDLIQYFFGTPDSVLCSARNFNKLNIEVEETCEAIFEYTDKTVTLHLDYLQKDYDRNIKILADEGKILWNWHENKVKVSKHKGECYEVPLENFNVNQLYIDELNHFLDLINSKKLCHSLDQHHAFENTKMMLLMHESNRTNSKLKVNEINF